MKKERYTSNIQLTVLTPVAIGSGSTLSPYAHYVCDQKKIYLIDKNKLERVLAGDDVLMQAYITGIVEKMDNNRSDFDLKLFIENELKIPFSDMCIRIYPLDTSENQKLEIKEMLKSPLGEPYIPGSTLKGAFKTALLDNWLNRCDPKKTDQLQNKWLSSFAAYCNETENHKLMSVFDENDKKAGKLKDDESTDSYNILMQVSDSKVIDPKFIQVTDCYRSIPMRLECIKRGAKTHFEVQTSEPWHKLAFAINMYSYYSTKHHEANSINNDIKSELDEASDNKKSNIAYMRLGFGKGFYFNSVADAIADNFEEEKNKANLNSYIAYLEKEYGEMDKFEEFPKTYLKTMRTEEVLGWVKLEKIES